MFETLRIIEGIGNWKPRFVIWENVKNVFSKKLVGAFNRYLEDIEKLGYTNSYQVLDAREFGIPQARERIFTVSILGGETFEFSRLRKREMKPIHKFLESDVCESYTITQPSTLSKLPGAYRLDRISGYWI